MIWRLPYVRADGDAKAKPFADALSAREWLLSGAIGVLGLAPIALACTYLTGAFDARGLVTAIIAAIVAAEITALLAAAYFRRRIGGYTGDCLGAVQQLTELAFLLGTLAMINR